MSRLDTPPVSRRSFLSLSALGSFLAALGVAMAGVLRLPKPTVWPGPVRRYKIGYPEQYPVGRETFLAPKGIFVFHDPEGVYAVSSVCTHLGCAVSRSVEGFSCP